MPAPAIFKDPEHQRLFEKQGYLSLPFLNEEEVRHMDQLFDELHPELPESGFYSGSYSTDMEYKRKVSEEIKRVFGRRYEEVFQNYTPFGGAYLIKVPSENSDMFIHQDWSIVEEDKHVALNIWVPLCDITPDNGPLMVLPGSHYDAFPVLRAPTMPYFFDNYPQMAIDQMEPMLVKAGHAVILNQSLAHYSPPNLSGKVRKAITAGVKTKDAQMYFHYKDKERQDNKIEKFEMEDEFLIHFEDFFKAIFSRPTVGKSVGFIDYEVPMLERDELETLIKKMKTDAGFEFKEIAREPEPEPVVVEQHEPVADDKKFWEVYTPANIIREIKFRLTGS